MNKNRYHNKNILIIGASFGIGQALFEAFDQAGANLIISARSQEKIEALAKTHTPLHNHPAALREDRRAQQFEEGSRLLKNDPSSVHCVHRSSLKGRMICGV